MKVRIYDHAFHFAGGGQRYAATLAEILQDEYPEPVKQQGIFPGAILAAPIRVVNQIRCGSLGGYGPQEEKLINICR